MRVQNGSLRRSVPLVGFAALGLLLLAGCDSGEIAPVSGTVTLDGAPLQGAYLTFVPHKGGRPSAARTDGQGHYHLVYARRFRGALPGPHSVSIRTFVMGDPDADLDERQRDVPEKVPARYNEETELVKIVEPRGSIIHFDLDSRGPIKLPPERSGEGGYGGE